MQRFERTHFLSESMTESTESPSSLVELADRAKEEGNAAFKKQDYETAYDFYSQAIELCPESHSQNRAVYLANRATCSLKLGNPQAAVDDCTAAIEYNPDYRKAYLKRAHALIALPERPHFDEALQDLRHLAGLTPPDAEAVQMIPDIERRAEAERERMKTEMVGQLKDLGNTFLGWFGLSTDNFKAEKDPNTGQYSIQFVQKPNSTSTSADSSSRGAGAQPDPLSRPTPTRPTHTQRANTADELGFESPEDDEGSDYDSADDYE